MVWFFLKKFKDVIVEKVQLYYLFIFKKKSTMRKREIAYFILSVILYLVTADDYPSDSSTRIFLQIGSSISGALETSTDEDWFKTIFVAGRSYTIINQKTTAIDAELTIKGPSPSLAQVAYNDDGFGTRSSSKIVFTPTTTGIYFLIPTSYDGSVGTYKLAISEPGGCSVQCTCKNFFERKK